MKEKLHLAFVARPRPGPVPPLAAILFVRCIAMTLQIHLKSTERQFPLLASDMSHVFHVSHFEMAQEGTLM